MKPLRPTTELIAKSHLADLQSQLTDTQTRLEQLSLWQPATGLAHLTREGLAMTSQIDARWHQKLIVSLLGPCGSGKSTLFNALAGIDDLSPSGTRRPTTSTPLVWSRDEAEGRRVQETAGLEMIVRSEPSVQIPEGLILVDTPDTDSLEGQLQIEGVQRIVKMTDVLILLFDAENPNRKDQIDFLQGFVKLFHGEALLVVLNKCDRLDEMELKTEIVPSFAAQLESVWQVEIAHLWCIAARRHLQNPGWAAAAEPRHAFDQYDEFKQRVWSFSAQSQAGVKLRLQNARQIKKTVDSHIQAVFADRWAGMLEAQEQINRLEANAMQAALTVIQSQQDRLDHGVSGQLFGRLAQNWLGPIGWVAGLWARLTMLGAGLGALVRYGNPLRQFKSLLAALKQPETAMIEPEAIPQKNNAAHMALQAYRHRIVSEWPQIADTLCTVGFSADIRQVEQMIDQDQPMETLIEQQWQLAIEHSVQRAVQQMSNAGLQLLFNRPVLLLLVYIGWTTMQHFIDRAYLPANYFTHALWALLIVWGLSFFLWQSLVRLAASPKRLITRAFRSLQASLQNHHPLKGKPVIEQLSASLNLARQIEQQNNL